MGVLDLEKIAKDSVKKSINTKQAIHELSCLIQNSNLSENELSKITGVSRTAIGKYRKKNNKALPDLETIYALVRAITNEDQADNIKETLFLRSYYNLAQIFSQKEKIEFLVGNSQNYIVEDPKEYLIIMMAGSTFGSEIGFIKSIIYKHTVEKIKNEPFMESFLKVSHMIKETVEKDVDDLIQKLVNKDLVRVSSDKVYLIGDPDYSLNAVKGVFAIINQASSEEEINNCSEVMLRKVNTETKEKIQKITSQFIKNISSLVYSPQNNGSEEIILSINTNLNLK